MTRETIRKTFWEWGCHAFQAVLAADFLHEEAAPHHFLITPPGLGRVLIASQIVRHLVDHQQARRVLVVTPSPIGMLWRSRLQSLVTQVPVQFMYVRAFRELSAAAEPWREPIVAIVPCDTARRPEVQKALVSASWDVVILAEVQADSRYRPLDLYRQMLAAGSVKRSLLIGAAPLLQTGSDDPNPLPAFHVTDWQGEISDWSGNTIELPEVTWRVAEYTRSDQEVNFLRLVQARLNQSLETDGPFRFETQLLVRRAASSPYAARRTLEVMGRKLGRASLHRLEAVPETQHGDPTEIEDLPRLSFSPEARRSYLQFVQEAFDLFQQIELDAKRHCLLELLGDVTDGRPGRVCVLSAYADTVAYLHQTLSQIGRPSVVINGGLRYSERQQAMKDFVTGGGILLATPGALGEESDLNRVRRVIHYDLPANRSQLAQLEGRFGRINRTYPCRMYALEDLSGADPNVPDIQQLLGGRDFLRRRIGAPA